MKKHLTKLLTIGLFAVAAAAAYGQSTWVTGSYTEGTTLLYPASAVSNVAAYSGWIDVRKTENVSLRGSFTCDAAGTNISFNWIGAPDTSTSIPTNTQNFTLVVPYNSTTANVGSTNWNVGGHGFIKLVSWGPNYDADSDVTNVVITYGYLIKDGP